MRRVTFPRLSTAFGLVVAATLIASAAPPAAAQAQGSPAYCQESNSYFLLVRANVDWQTAFDQARSMSYSGRHGRLAEPRSYGVDYFIRSRWGSNLHGAWLGGLRDRTSILVAPWYWASSGGQISYFPGGYLNIMSNSGGKEDRLNYWSDGSGVRWNDISRNATGSYVVEFR